MWAGKTIRHNRKSGPDGGPSHVYAPRPFLCVLGAVPSEQLHQFVGHDGEGDGFIDRILFCCLRNFTPGYWTDAAVQKEVKDPWFEVIDALRELSPASVRLCEDAQGVWAEEWDDFVEDVRCSDLPSHLENVASKLKVYAVRFALLLQSMRLASEETTSSDVEVITVYAAWDLARYFLAQAARAFDNLHDDLATKQEARLIHWIRKTAAGKQDFTFTLDQAFKGVKSRSLFKDKKVLMATVKRMAERYDLEKVYEKPGPGRPAERYKVGNPGLLS